MTGMLVTLLFILAAAQADYQQCNAKNDYLEARLSPRGAFVFCAVCNVPNSTATEHFDDFSRIHRELTLPPACVLASLESTPDHVYKFGVCDDGTGKIRTKNVEKPCISESYHFLAYLSYLEAMTCLGIDPREMFGLLNLESNFQTNIGSFSGAWGVGQLTGVAVATTNQFKRLAPYAQRKECEPLKRYFEAPMSDKNACEWIGVPENPARNFLYAGITYLTFKKLAAVEVAKALPLAKLKPAERERAIFDITAYMYNGGDGGVRQALRVFLEEKGPAPLSYSVFKAEFRDYLREYFGSSIPYYAARPDALAGKRREVSMYVGGIESRLAKVEKAAGVKCSR